MKVVILCGVSGSGKSTLVRKEYKTAVVCSADSYFERVDGEYAFDASKLSEAHGLCLRQFVALVTNPGCDFRITEYNDVVVVDNTNTTIAEMAPYVALAQAYGHDLEIVTLRCDPVDAAARGKHGVPLESVIAQSVRLYSRDIPPWWPHRYAEVA